MRSLALAIVLGACGSTLARPSVPSIIVTPARDLSTAKTAASHGAAGAPDATAGRDPRVVDLDIIRITAHASAPGADPELSSVASADLFKQANQAVKDGRPSEAISTYLQLVGEFP